MAVRFITFAALLILSSGVREKIKNKQLASSTEDFAANASLRVEKVPIPIEGAEDTEDDVRVFGHSELAEGMMKPDPSFPSALRHIIWMDQAGQYASSTGMPRRYALPDALVLVAQQGSKIDDKGWQKLKTCNGGWSWFWTAGGREEYRKLREKKGACHNWVEWKNAERTKGRFYGLMNADPNSFIEKHVTNIGVTLMPWWDCKLNGNQCEEAAKVTCPPEKEELRYKCALWERWNYAGPISVGTYYAFAVVDPDGNPIEPYYTAFQEAMKTNKYGPQEQFVGNIDHDDWD